MRKWYKFEVDAKLGQTVLLQDKNDHKRKDSLVTFDPDAYQSKEEFFKKYLFGVDEGRFELYHNFLKQHLPKEGEIFALGCGRCANELYLMEEGYKIVCSDHDYPSGFYETEKIFPKLKFRILNSIKESPPGVSDSIIALGLIYLLNEQELIHFFRLVSIGLKRGGTLILDAGGAPDNWLSHFINDIVLWHEAMMDRMVVSLFQKRVCGLIVKNFGFRRTDQEIINAAQKADLTLTVQENYGYLTEFRRSRFFSFCIDYIPFLDNLFECLGKRIPHIRLFKFEKSTLL